MKKSFILVSALVLTAALFTGCGCRNSQPAGTTAPTTMPTTATTSEPTTRETTMPTMETSIPTVGPTIEDGNGPLDSSPNATEDTGMTGRSRNSGMG